MKLRILLITFIALVFSATSQAQLLQWNTFGNVGTETSEPSVANLTGVGASNLTFGTGVTPVGNSNRFGGQDWYSGAGTLAQAITGNDYIEFTVTPTLGYSFTATSLVFGWDRSNTGPSAVALRSSVDGYAANLGTFTGMAASQSNGNTISISGLSNISTATTFRLYGYGATAAGGTGGFDTASNAVNVVLNGTTSLVAFITTQNGDWQTGATWVGGIVPSASDNVIIDHNVTTSAPITRNAGTNTVINSGDMLTASTTYNNSGTTTVNGTFITSGAGVSINAGSTFLINGTGYIYPGGFFINGSPIWGSSSNLIYATNGTFGRGLEWSALGAGTIGVTPGYPNNVQLSVNTTFDYNNGTPLAKAINGNLTINAGTSFYMDYGGGASGGTLTVAGNVTNGGNFTLGNASGDDLKIGGNFTQVAGAVFNGNNRAVFFIKNGVQTINSAVPLTIPHLVFQPVSGSTTVQLLSDLTVSAPLGNAISFGSASDVFDIIGRTLTIGTSGVANTIVGTGTFKGSTGSTMNLLGTGSIGTLNFTTGFQVLGTLTADRTAGAPAFVLGTPVTINTSLALTNGCADLGNNPMTIGSTGTMTSSSTNYVIADIANGTSAQLRKIFAAGGTFSFPIGDRTASANGSQYSPISVTMPAATYAATAYAGVAVNDIKHLNFDAATEYITRYWSVSTSGVTGATNFTATGTYQDVDINTPISEANYKGNKWNGSAWSNGGSTGGAAANSTLAVPCTIVGTNEITSGLRDQDINVVQGVTQYIHTSTYDFGSQLTGSNTDVTFTVQNLGERSLSIASSSITGNPPYSIFAALTNGGLAGPLGTRTFTIRFSPVAAGTFTGSFTIVNNDPTGSEAPYVINFTGIGVVPVPEINIRGNSITIAPGNTPTGLDNTLFAAQNIGVTSAAKTYEIQNLGTATLTLTGSFVTLGGAHPGDFALASMPATSIAASGNSTFSITFTPTFAGTRTATVSVFSNDSDEPTYTYNIQGTGSCAAATNTITPLSGPVNTEVTITASANTLTGATATFNGIAAAVTQISPTQITVKVPVGATSGNLVTTNSQGCQATNYFTVIDDLISSCQGNSQPPRTQIFISEVTDHGTGQHSYVELYNATGAAVNIGGYTVRIHNNGAASATSTITLPSFSMPNNSSYVIGFGGSDMNANWGSFTPNFTHNASGVNDDDNIRLYNPGGTWLDLWGNTAGTVFTIAPKDYTYRRKNTGIVAPSTTWNPSDWEAFTPVDYSNIGQYDFSTGIPPTVTQNPAYTPSCKATTFTVAGAEGFIGGNALSYQWYYAAPNSATWTPVTDGGIYSGATTTTLTISNVSGLDNYQYYCQIRENTATCYAATNAVKIDEAQTVTWNGTSWSPGAPTLADVAVINGPYNTLANGNIDACSVVVNTGNTLTVSPNTYVNIQNDLTVSTGGTLTIADDGSLIMIDDLGVVTNNGTTTVSRTTTPYQKFDYTYWSSPVTNAVIATTFPTWRLDYAFQFTTANYADVVAPINGFDDDGNAWQNVSGVMTPGKGYAIMAPTSGSFPATSTVTFSGQLNNGVVPIAVNLSANSASSIDDFNLIGNPYASAIYADKFINQNAILNSRISGTIYFWTHRTAIAPAPGPNAYNFITTDYAMYNLSGAVGTGTGTGSGTGSTAPTGYIASGQGFFVDAVSATNVIFNNAMRDKTYGNADFFRHSASVTEESPEKDRVWINLQSSEGLFSQQLVGYFENATLGVDVAYDGIVSKTSNTISFYSFIDNDNYRIQARPAFDINDQVPLGYSTGVAHSYTISIDHTEGQLDSQDTDIFIEDKTLNIIHDLKQGPYSFTTEAGTFDDRFLLRYTDGSLAVPEMDYENQVAVASTGGLISIRSEVENLDQITIYDIAGRVVFNAGNISSNSLEISDVVRNTQALIVKIKLENGAIVTRKLLF